MRLPHISGKIVNKSLEEYRVNWDAPCKSKFQFNVKQFFREYWEHDDCVEEFPVIGTKLSCDLINFSKKYAVEMDGNFHDKFSKFHHGTRMGLLSSIKRDEKKVKWMEMCGLYWIRIREKDFKKLSYDWIKNTFEIDILDTFVDNKDISL